MNIEIEGVARNVCLIVNIVKLKLMITLEKFVSVSSSIKP